MSDILSRTDHWLDGDYPAADVAFSTRGRFARNVARHAFAPHAPGSALAEVCRVIADAFKTSQRLSAFEPLELGKLSGVERRLLKESRLISPEMESGAAHRMAYIDADARTSVLVNEEDHLRLQCLEPGMQGLALLTRLIDLDAEVAHVLTYAFHERLGYLTACPTNVGTGLRISVMLHLPALSMAQEMEILQQGASQYGLTARGFYGENSEFAGEFYQISNEVTLGMAPADIAGTLMGVVTRLIEREQEARLVLFKKAALGTEDTVWRSHALLTNARRIDTAEAMRLLSPLRLGIDREWFPGLTHIALNHLFLEIQPAHMERAMAGTPDPGGRDVRRARLLRERLLGHASPN